ncbi:uncharacterized protein Dana_GF22463 [Drosophila ananassae]|uniref:Elongation of very long chain fatty acids protein n=1 Tax=Drosophila ananassae TaxID=7217 RepID=B3MUL0_DROAN|nr:elongation of very long chain fatty acids protein F [Drosophila ananassae]EDV32925.1 uncharacterized protein Dana_GF22463 [Drosophila ananassae]
MLTPVDPERLALYASPWPTFLIMSSYLVFVLKLGPKLMEERKALNLRTFIKYYNIGQIIYNVTIIYYGAKFLFFMDTYDLKCIKPLPLAHKHKDYERWMTNLYAINKLIDLSETVVFVLRKKNKQISFLHVFHHVVMAGTCYFIITLNGHGGILFPFCLINALVHAIMYTYYYLSSMNETLQKNIWWKKYITIIQLLQFGVIMVIFLRMTMDPNCSTPPFTNYVVGIVIPSFIILFINFFYKSYILSDKKRVKLPQDPPN